MLILVLLPTKVQAIGDTSRSSIVMDIETGRILYKNNINDSMLIASTTKIMTFLVAYTYAKERLDEKVIAGDEVLKMYGTNIYIEMNEEMTLRDLLYGLMLRSGNDASVVIATYVSGNIDDFVYLMNEKAKEIGMINTSFKNPHGLDEETKNYSTSYDLAVLTRYLYLNIPLYKEIGGTKNYSTKSNLKSYAWTNRCKLIFTYDKTTTAKNGYTPSAGKSLASTASNNNLNLLVVTLDDPNIYGTHENLYEYFFSKYYNYTLLSKDDFVLSDNLIPAKTMIKNSFIYPLTKEERENVTTKIIINDKDDSEIKGIVNILLNDEIIHSENIYEKKANEITESLWQRIIGFFKNLF